MSAVVLNNGLVHYEAIGRGAGPLVFVHGWLGSWRYWVPAMEQLSITRRTYALDLWGFGDSDKHREYDVAAYVDLLQAFLDEMGIQRVALVGHSLGGLVALHLAARSPERVGQVMGVSVPLLGTSIDPSFAQALAPRRSPPIDPSGNGDALARLIARRASFPEVEREARKADPHAITTSVRSALELDLREASLPSYVPVLLVHGEEDPLIQAPRPELLREFAPNARVVLLNGTQHFPMLEQKNKFNRLLMDFLRAGGDLDSLELKEEWQRRLR
jgi:pimeloyl-ACP methyl ester carboxylesterase